MGWPLKHGIHNSQVKFVDLFYLKKPFIDVFIAKNLQYVFVEREIQGRINVFEFSQVFSVPEA